MNHVHSTVVSLVLTVLLTIGCTHLLFSDQAFAKTHEADELALASTRRSQIATTPGPEPLPDHDANPPTSEWVSVPNFTTPAPAPPRGPAPAWHTVPAVTNHSRPELFF